MRGAAAAAVSTAGYPFQRPPTGCGTIDCGLRAATGDSMSATAKLFGAAVAGCAAGVSIVEVDAAIAGTGGVLG